MAATQLGLFNEALRLIGERRLASTTENREPARLLLDVWADGAVNYCLEQGQWKFAMRAVKITKSTTSIPAFGYANAFDMPNDHIRTCGVCQDEFFDTPLLAVLEEVGFWFADIDPIYVRYISNAANYGNDLTRWPSTFTKYVAAFLASEVVLSLTQSPDKVKEIYAILAQRLKDARSKDALQGATAFPPPGSWSGARRQGGNNARQNKNQLIG